MTDVPVLFIPFSRPEYARQVFDKIKSVKPKKFYFYIDKARPDRPCEIQNNEIIKNFLNEVDWDCDLKTLIREENFGIYKSLFSAIDWVFENEEQAIILEEDCLPTLAFFDYCEYLLAKFKSDRRIFLISGNNFFEEYNPNGHDYIFTRYAYQYGWATWRDRWHLVERDNIKWDKIKSYELYRQLFPSKKEAEFHIKREEVIFNFIKTNPSWDYIFGFTAKNHGAFGIIPSKNLVANIGVKGEHNKTSDKFIHNKKIFKGDKFPINDEPLFVVPDYKYDRYFFKKFYQNRYLLINRMVRKLKKTILKIVDL